MQQGWDDIDRLITDSFEDVNISNDYNCRLMAKMHKGSRSRIQNYTAAFSLIMAGFLIMFMYTADLQYKIFDMQYRVKTHVLSIEYNLNSITKLIGR